MSKYKIDRNDLDLNNIQIGQIIDSYSQLCKLLGIEPKQGGTSRVAQKKELERYIDFENITRSKILIKDIYIIPKPKIDKREEGNNAVYRDCFIVGLISLLRKNKRNYFLCSRGFLIEQLGFVNKNYRSCRSNPKETALELKIPEANLLDFYMINNTKLIKNIESNLNYFENKSYYIVDKVTAVCIKDEDRDIHRVATDDEKELILKCENEVKKNLGIQDNSEIFIKHMWTIFNDNVKQKLKDKGSNISYYYKAYYFTIYRDKIEELYQTLVKEEKSSLGKIRKEINDKYKESAINSLDSRQKNAQDRLQKGTNNKFATERDKMLTDDKFKKHGKKLINNLISKNANSIQITFFEEEIPFEGSEE